MVVNPIASYTGRPIGDACRTTVSNPRCLPASAAAHERAVPTPRRRASARVPTATTPLAPPPWIATEVPTDVPSSLPDEDLDVGVFHERSVEQELCEVAGHPRGGRDPDGRVRSDLLARHHLDALGECRSLGHRM